MNASNLNEDWKQSYLQKKFKFAKDWEIKIDDII